MATPFLEVLERRHSVRRLAPASIPRLAALLWHGARTRLTGIGRLGLAWEHRAAASAGGLHPITIVVSSIDSDIVYAYDPVRHALLEVEALDKLGLEKFHADVRGIVPEAHSQVLTLMAIPSRTAAAYENPESLVWRDAGNLLAVLNLCATYLQLGFCQLGLLGDGLASALPDSGGLQPTGVALVGEEVR